MHVVPDDRCCGCGLCAAVCPQRCIELRVDIKGFIVPFVDEKLCTDCSLCKKCCDGVCLDEMPSNRSSYWAQSKDELLVETSSSGGVFGELAKEALREGGVVYGATFSCDCKSVEHVRVASQEELRKIRGSKYVQSKILPSLYLQIEQDLQSGKKVLFSGTPCQTRAMSRYFSRKGIDDELLFLVDVFCHGVPSPRLWADWVDYLSCREGSGLSSALFRDKSTGWASYSVCYTFQNGVRKKWLASSDWYMKAFLANASLRTSCFACTAKFNSGSDLSLGDYWSIKSAHPEVCVNNGISAIIVRSEKGERLLKAMSGRCLFGESHLDNILVANSAAVKSVEPFADYDSFMEAVSSGESITDIRARWPFDEQFKTRVRRLAGRILRKISLLRS